MYYDRETAERAIRCAREILEWIEEVSPCELKS